MANNPPNSQQTMPGQTPVNIRIEDLEAPQPDMTAKIIKFSGQLDESNIDQNSKTIYDVIAQHPKNLYLLFDFTELQYMNSKSIGYLTDWYGKINEEGGKAVILGAPATILDILQAVGITELIKCYNSMDEAKLNLFKKDA